MWCSTLEVRRTGLFDACSIPGRAHPLKEDHFWLLMSLSNLSCVVRRPPYSQVLLLSDCMASWLHPQRTSLRLLRCAVWWWAD